MVLGRFCWLIISLVLNYQFLPVMLRLSKAFTAVIMEYKTPMALVNRVIETRCSRGKAKRFLMMLQKYAGDGTQFISLYRINLVGENMLRMLTLVDKCKFLQELDLSHTGLTCMSVKLLVRAFQKLLKLHTLKLDDNRIKGRGLLTLAQASGACVNIKKLELEGNPVFYEIDVDMSCLTFNITNLDLSKTGFTNECMQVLVVQQKKAKENSRVVLTELRISGNELTWEGGRYAADLMMLGELQHLDICENKIGCAGAASIAMALETSSIKGLRMASNGMGLYGALALAHGFTKSTTVFSVYLVGNEFSEEGIQALEAAWQEHKTMRYLDLY